MRDMGYRYRSPSRTKYFSNRYHGAQGIIKPKAHGKSKPFMNRGIQPGVEGRLCGSFESQDFEVCNTLLLTKPGAEHHGYEPSLL